jgi:hypothetical protein
MHELSILLEFGATDYLTLFVRPDIRWVDAGGVEEQGHSHTDLGLRMRVFDGGNDVFALQGMITLPGDIDSIGNVRLMQGESEYEARALYGANFDLRGIPGFIDLEGAYRWRDGGPANEIHADFTLGWQPQRATQVRIESLNVWGDGAGEDQITYPYFRQHKVRASLRMFTAPDAWVEVGGFYTWDGQNVLAEDGVFVSGGYTF